MKRIGFVSGNISRSGGTERVATLIANELIKNYEIYIISYGPEGKSYFYLNPDIKIINLSHGKSKIRNKLTAAYKLRKIIKKYNIDTLIDIDVILSINTLIATYKLDTEVISWEHFNFYSNVGVKRRDWARRLAAKYSDQIITLTEQDKNQYLSNLNVVSKIDYIYNPTPYPHAQKSLCKNRTAIAVGRLNYQKGFDRLLQIWGQIEKKDREWKLLIIGSGEDRDKLLKQIEELKLERVEIIEHTEEIKKYYEDASIYLMTSRFEGLPMTLIEAQSFGIPVISYDIKTGPRDIVLNNRNGYLIEDGNERDFIDKFLQLSGDSLKIQEFSRNAYEDSGRFGMENIIKKWEEILK
ncbi:MAG: glycosyltransferase family 4 protein [Fusobacteriaceae bacterium]